MLGLIDASIILKPLVLPSAYTLGVMERISPLILFNSDMR